MSEFLNFKMHPGLLKSIIAQQAGSLEKAFLELIMNSVDAGATKINIKISDNTFSIKDDGKGLGSKEDIEANFQYFGTPHKEGDAEFGRFRMGRGQIMPFAKTTWKSGAYSITTDLENTNAENLGFKLGALGKAHKGCEVSGIIYDKVLKSEGISSVSKLTHTLPKMVKYIKVPIFINGALITLDLNTVPWDKETDEAYFKFDTEAQNITIYNKGVFVKDSPSYYYGGMGGVVVSKKALNVNFARNDIISYDCEVMASINNTLRVELGRRQKLKNKMSFAERKYYAEQLVSAELDWESMVEKKIFKTVNNRYFSLLNIAGSTQHKSFALISDTTKNEAEYVMKSRLCIVFDDDILRLFDIENLNELIDILKYSLQKYNMDKKATSSTRRVVLSELLNWSNVVAIVDLENYGDMVLDSIKILKNSELQQKEIIVLNTLKTKNKNLAFIASTVTNISIEPRKLLVGESLFSEAWTDGNSYIAIDRKKLTEAEHGVNGFSKLYALLLHEYLHTQNSGSAHPHNDEFYNAFHDAILDIPQHQGIFELARSSSKLYAGKLKNKKIPVSKKLNEDTRYVSEMRDNLRIKNGLNYFYYSVENFAIENFRSAIDFDESGIYHDDRYASVSAENLLHIRALMNIEIQRHLAKHLMLGLFGVLLKWHEQQIFLDYLILHRKFYAFMKVKIDFLDDFIEDFRLENKLTEPAFLIYFSRLALMGSEE